MVHNPVLRANQSPMTISALVIQPKPITVQLKPITCPPTNPIIAGATMGWRTVIPSAHFLPQDSHPIRLTPPSYHKERFIQHICVTPDNALKGIRTINMKLKRPKYILV